MSLKVNSTNAFAVFDLPSVQVNSNHAKEIEKSKKREQSRSNKEHGDRMSSGGLIGGHFDLSHDAPYIKPRSDIFEKLWGIQESAKSALADVQIKVTLPNGDVKVGVAGKTTPFDIAKGISQGLADNIIVAKVVYTGAKFDSENIIACDDDDESDVAKTDKKDAAAELWDVNRPLVGDCNLTLLKYDDPESKVVFSHSSAHILGAALEGVYGAYLTIGPPLQQGFYYDCFMGEHTIHDSDLKKIEDKAADITKKKYPFQRLVVTKEEVGGWAYAVHV